jgi:hypothetical protein
MSRPQVTVIIPTRERALSLESTLRTATSQAVPGLEIIVSDNASIDATADVVRANADPRIRYLNTGRRLGMSSNWEFALGEARGDWITVLGDDDALLPGGLEDAITLAERAGTRAVRCRPCEYLWPNVSGGADGRLAVPLGGRTEVVDGKSALADVMEGRAAYTGLPTIYTGGLLRRDAIDEGRGPDGRFFRSQIPDVYSAVRFTAMGDRFVRTSRPFAINGASRMSTGISMFHSGDPKAGPSPARMFQEEANLPLHPTVPETRTGGHPRSIHALVLEAYQQVREIDPSLPALDLAAQLRIIRASTDNHRHELELWCRDFAALNDVRLRNPEPGLRLRQAIGSRLGRFRPDRLVVSDHRNPQVPTVMEASRVAARLLAEPPPSLAGVAINWARFLRNRHAVPRAA